jgi:zinc protease
MLRLCFLLLLVIVPHVAPANDHTATHEFNLDNGLKVLVKEDHRAPVVISEIWYKVGSSYEPAGVTGVSHVLEHMMFKGTDKHPPGEFSRIIAANGGRENAFTSRDYTGYYQQLEKSRLPVSMEMESDRMRNLRLSQEEFAKERQVVIEERRLRVEDNPQAILSEHFNATAHINSPYHQPVIGWMNDLQHMELDDLQTWYETWYAPNNATLVVVGDVDPQEVLKLAKKHYGPLKPSDIKQLKPRREIAQRGTRRINVKAPAELPYLIMGYQAPVLRTAEEDWEPYALEVLAYILDGGDSARFSNNLIRGQQIAAGTSVSYNPYARHDAVFVVEGTPTQDHDVATLEKAMTAEIIKLQESLASSEELERVKAQVVASAVYEQDSIYYQAMLLGMLESVGLDWRVADEYVDRIKAVNAEQVQAVAKKYLISDRLTVATLDPQPINGEQVSMNAKGNDNVN